MNIQSRIENLRQGGDGFQKVAALNLGASALNGFGAMFYEGFMHKLNVTGAVFSGVVATAAAIEGWRQHVQADRLEVVLAQQEPVLTSMETPRI